ncbi:hypothetical protein [Streptosporangium lutulentum]|uniref:Uncharacterized protein n=1 Tax=Streptosporangium lutulentum TaxID=1461250 RepID=A0ABT9Q6H6_9ACTN|nr:hypothetical protein [Streptosporangium lutulentum]MDP9842356.1 hypothetical protein [Streptosporangium lutulentum]
MLGAEWEVLEAARLAETDDRELSRRGDSILGALRQARADYRAKQARMILGLPAPGEQETLTLSQWRYGGSGHRYGEPFWAELARQRIATTRRIAREREQPDPG